MAEIKAQKKYRILIIDGHPLFREGFKAIVNRDPRFEIIGETGDGREGLRLVRTSEPDLVVMEMSLPDQDAVPLIKGMRHLFPKLPIMILSVYPEIQYVSQALNAGATGYVAKEIDSGTLFEGFEAVLKGDRFLACSAPPDSIVKQSESFHLSKKVADKQIKCLTPREQEIMRFMAEGVPRKEIAKRLYISPKTVENHAWKIMKKLSLNNIFEVVRYAAKLGLIDVDLWKGETNTDRLLAQQM